jgi:hypothetical protein
MAEKGSDYTGHFGNNLSGWCIMFVSAVDCIQSVSRRNVYKGHPIYGMLYL